MSTEHDPAVIARLQAQFSRFAAHSLQDEPLYRAIAGLVARQDEWAALLAAAPPTQRWARLWFAALQDRLLARLEAGERPPLADYFPGADAPRIPDAALAVHLGAFIEAERDAMRATIATRNTQTNEIGRCAVLWPVLQSLVEATGNARIALLDVGCSAGLNLGVDRWRYRWVDDVTGATVAATPTSRDARAPEIACRLLAGTRAGSVARDAMPEIVTRAGIDLAPVAVDDPVDVRWLRACIWPGDTERRARFDAAVDVARGQAWTLRACTDAAAAVGQWLDTLPSDVVPVVFNSWVLAYFDDALLRDHVDRLLGFVAGRGACWLSAEDPTQSRTWWPARPVTTADGLPNATSWTLARPDGGGGVDWSLAATSHAHGRWMLCEG